MTTNSPNNTILLQNGLIVFVTSITAQSDDFGKDDIIFESKILLNNGPVFEYPVNSALFNIYKITDSSTLTNVCKFKLNDIKCKMACLSIFEMEEDIKETFVVPLLHCENYNNDY